MPIISYETKSKEVEILNQSIDISNKLFISTKADYIEVLLTQREALDSRIELIETKLKQLKAKVNYTELWGGWMELRLILCTQKRSNQVKGL